MIVGYLSEYVHGKQLGYVHDKQFLVDGFNIFHHLENYEVSWDGLSHILWTIRLMFQTTRLGFASEVWQP